ncbi:MAG TPA: calcium-binding protein [Rhizomicrobium sp.]|nr:calcium-binding protein [Rhizomicrobium sp.]
MVTFTGITGDDSYVGGLGDDVFDLSQGGNDTAEGAEGADVFQFGATFNAQDSINGGDGTDTLVLNGDYSTKLNLGLSSFYSIERIQLADGFNYNLKLQDSAVTNFTTLTVDASSLTAPHHLTFNGALEQGGSFDITGGAGDDTVTGGAVDDVIRGGDGNDRLSAGPSGNDTIDGGNGNDDITAGASGSDTITGGAGNDTIRVSGTFNPNNQIDGGIGNDTLVLAGDYSAGFTPTTAMLQNIETIKLTNHYDYDFTISQEVAGTLDGGALGAGNSLSVTVSHTSLTIIGGAGDDTVMFANPGGSQRGAAVVDLSRGGNDTVENSGNSVGASLEKILFGGAYTTDDVINGDRAIEVVFNGEYAAPLTFDPAHFVNVKTITLGRGHDYNLAFGAVSNAQDGAMVFDAGALGAANTATIDASAVLISDVGSTPSMATLIGGGGDDVLIGRATQSSTFDLHRGGDDHATGGSAADVFDFGAGFSSGDVIAGGAGHDTVNFSGTYKGPAIHVGAANFTGVDEFTFRHPGDEDARPHPYTSKLVIDGTFTTDAGQPLTITGYDTSVRDIAVLKLDGSASSVALDISLGKGNDTIQGSAFADTITDHGGYDIINAGDGADTITDQSGGIAQGEGGDDVIIIGHGGHAGGGSGNDTLTAIDGGGVLSGGAGDDILTSTKVNANGTSTLDGGRGDDVLTSNSVAAHDILTGGAGADVFQFSEAPVAYYDTITDFTAQDHIHVDHLKLAQIHITEAGPHSLSEATFASDIGAVSHNLESGEIRIFVATGGDMAGERFLICGIGAQTLGALIHADGTTPITADAFV